VEEVSKITKLKQSQHVAFEAGGKMIVNTEWGAFNNSVGRLFYSNNTL
jgi:hexokinase